VAKVAVTMSLRQEDLSRLDELASDRRLTRGDAVGFLLDETLGRAGITPTQPNRSRLGAAREILQKAESAVGVESRLVDDSEEFSQ
jgi:hypothetical protein